MYKQYIKFNGECREVIEVHDYGYPMIELDDGTEWHIFNSHDTAGEYAREYWENLAQDDPQEFTCIVGERALIAWGLGQAYAPGSVSVHSLEEWLDLWLDVPEEHFASYDGQEIEIEWIDPDLAEELDLTQGFSLKERIYNGKHYITRGHLGYDYAVYTVIYRAN